MKVLSIEGIHDFAGLLERGWWTTSEAFCIFMGMSPSNAGNESFCNQLRLSRQGQHIFDLVASAEVDGSIGGLTLIPWIGYRAPCIAWIKWAMKKPSISINPALLEAAGIDADNVSRPKESYRDKSERETKISFLAAARIALHICPKVRLKDITALMKLSQIPYELPSEKTRRKWLSEERIVLNDTRIPDDHIAEVEKMLNLVLPTSEDMNLLSTTEKS